MPQEQQPHNSEHTPWQLTFIKWTGTVGLTAVAIVKGAENYAESSNVVDLAIGGAAGVVIGSLFYGFCHLADRLPSEEGHEEEM